MTENKSKDLVDLKLPFPWKLHKLLQEAENNGETHIVSWMGDGKSFKVHKPKTFAEEVMPHYFSQTKFNSFRRQCYNYGFRLRRDGSFFHPHFDRDDVESWLVIRRNPTEDRKKKRKSQDASEGRLYKEVNEELSPSQPTLVEGALLTAKTTHASSSPLQKPNVPDVNMNGTSNDILNLANSVFEKSRFFDPFSDPLLSLDGSCYDIPLDSLDEIFRSEMAGTETWSVY